MCSVAPHTAQTKLFSPAAVRACGVDVDVDVVDDDDEEVVEVGSGGEEEELEIIEGEWEVEDCMLCTEATPNRA